MEELKPCDVVCQKCGGDDIHITYRPAGEWLKHYDKYNPAYADAYKVTKEHIHYHCRKCGYNWDTDPIDARTDPPEDITGLAHELWALAQLMPEEGILDGVMRIEEALQKYLGRKG
jgi:hypothetical protein